MGHYSRKNMLCCYMYIHGLYSRNNRLIMKISEGIVIDKLTLDLLDELLMTLEYSEHGLIGNRITMMRGKLMNLPPLQPLIEDAWKDGCFGEYISTKEI